MKRIPLILCCVTSVVLHSCSTDVDLYANYEQRPVVYGLLDANADTNFIKIARSFSVMGDSYQSAADPDSNNYPGRLDARLIEYRNGNFAREIILDTITLHNKKPGTFYAPGQKLYYTTEPLTMNTNNMDVRYTLKAVLPDRDLTTETALVGSRKFGVQSLGVNFAKEYFGKERTFLFHPAPNAEFYEISMTFHFMEQYTPTGDSVPRTMLWELGTFTDSEFAATMSGESYVFRYRPETFWIALEQFLGADTIGETRRFFGDHPVEFTIKAGGENLWKYMYFNEVLNGANTGEDTFSLIDGGYGVFSSRMTAKRRLGLAGRTVPDLLEKTNWGFKFIGGKN